jgi:hypothetical protein
MTTLDSSLVRSSFLNEEETNTRAGRKIVHAENKGSSTTKV